MIGHEEHQMSSFDPKILKRIFGYVRPYWLLVSISILCILLSTAGQLMLPVLLQRAVDENLRPAWVRIENSETQKLYEIDPRLEQEQRELGGYTFYPETMAGPAMRKLRRDFQLYFVIDSPVLDEKQRGQLSQREDIIFTDSAVALSEDSYKSLDSQLVESLRVGDREGIRQKGMLYLFLLIAVLILTFLQLFFMALAGQSVMKDLRMDLYGRTMSQKLSFLQNQQVGRLVTRVSSDVETINELFNTVLSAIIADVVMMVGVLTTLFLLNIRLGFYSLVIIPPVAILLVVFRSKAREAYRKVRTWVSAVNAYISEHLSGVSLVQAFVQERRVVNEFKKRNESLFKANIGELYVFTVFRPLIDILSTFSIAFILYFGGSSLLRGLVSLGVLIAFINLIQRFYQPVQDMAEKFTLIQSAMAGSERVFALLDEQQLERREGSFQMQKDDVAGEIRFEDVQFAYKKDEPVLRGISFSCTPGQSIALVGYTGSGKSTIANVLTGLWEIDAGRILLDGKDIRDIPMDILRSIIQPIQQDITLFHMSVRENLLLGNEMSDEDLFQILDKVEAGDFIRALPKGLDTVIAENSDNFSAGQLQLLSFARLLVQDPKIIIMDEATANIDTETEQKIQRALEILMEGRSSIVIAHRLSTVKDADTILVLEAGTIAEQGTHDELMKNDGLYKTLQEIQFKRMV